MPKKTTLSLSSSMNDEDVENNSNEKKITNLTKVMMKTNYIYVKPILTVSNVIQRLVLNAIYFIASKGAFRFHFINGKFLPR